MSLLKKLPLFVQKNMYLLLIALVAYLAAIISDKVAARQTKLEKSARVLENYIRENQQNFLQLFGNDALFMEATAQKSSEENLTLRQSLPYYTYFYKNIYQGKNVLLSWSTSKIVPPLEVVNSSEMSGFTLLANGYYAWFKQDYKQGRSIALLPVKWNYFISNTYLENDFAIPQSKTINNNFSIGFGKGSAGNVQLDNGKVLFHLVEQLKTGEQSTGLLSLWFCVIGILSLMLFLHLLASQLADRFGPYLGLGVLAGSLAGARFFSYLQPFHAFWRQWELFDPSVYGSNLINSSLGDLLINVLLALWLILFFREQVFKQRIRLRHHGNSLRKWAFTICGSSALLLSTFVGGSIIRSLVADAQISFDVLNFFSLNVYSVVGFFILTSLGIAYYFFCHTICYLIKDIFPGNAIPLYLSSAIAGLLILSFRIGKMENSFELYLLLWFLVFLYLITTQKLQLFASRFITSRIIFWVFFFSVSISAIMMNENSSKELRGRQHYAEMLALRSNPATEALLNSMLTDFRADFLAQNFYRFYDSTAAILFKDSIISNSFSGYKNRYDTRIYAFNNLEKPLNNRYGSSYNDLNTVLNSQARPTNIYGLFTYDESYDKYNYMIKKTIVDTSAAVVGYVFIQILPKNSQNESPYPELFGKQSSQIMANYNDYAFAIYNDDKLIRSQNDYPFSTDIKPGFFAGKQFILLEKPEYNELWYNAGAGKAVVVAKPHQLRIESITLFSYLFGCFLLLTSLAWLLQAIFRSGFDTQKLKNYFKLNIKEQIHGTIIFFSVVSFIVIGVATILFFVNRYESNNREKLSNTLLIIENQFQRALQGMTVADSLKPGSLPSLDSLKLSSVFSEISDIHGVELNLYNLEGDLKYSSLPLPYNKGIVSTKMNPLAYYHLYKAKEVQFFQKETIGNLDYLSSYRPLINDKGDTFAYLNIPYFTSQSKLRDEISNFLVTIINLNAFIFLIAGIVALFITNKITNTFLLIGEKMKQVNLGKINEAISWNRNDEIGKLVAEYNKMVAKLDQSAANLARTEREGAWREMAKQVAHEIKNPLTPMKLSMQFLQKAIATDAPNIKALSVSVAHTLIEQIDHLSQMADEFSRFAQIEKAVMGRVDLQDVLLGLNHLFDHSPNAVFDWQLLPDPVFVWADKTQLNRVFTNLIKNALQAVPEERLANIKITQELSEGKIITHVTDNGTGISEEASKKIFAPNFTTKSSGTGLGLAMSKRIIVQTMGDIYFTSDEMGTIFTVELPVMKD